MGPVSEERCINTIRVLSADMVEKANSGHPGAPMGLAPVAHVLFSKIMKYNPRDPSWFSRDRFVLSNGHSCALLYSMLHLTGYDRPSMSDLQQFRQLHSVTAGHPENFLLEGVEVSTGPLGQGISNAVGLAAAEKHLAAVYNKPGFENLINNYTYVICGDGCLQEGVSSEACSLAGHLRLNKLILLYDDNSITIDGKTSLSFTEDVGKRFEAYGWSVIEISKGNNDIESIEAAIKLSQHSDKPSLIKVKTLIGFGSDKAGSHDVHGSPLGKGSLEKVKTLFGFDPKQTFVVEDEVYAYYREAIARGEAKEAAWQDLFSEYRLVFPELGAELERRISNKLPTSWADGLPKYSPSVKPDATRNTSGIALNAAAAVLPELIGGSADLTPSTKTSLKNTTDFQDKTPSGKYFRFGVREHGMAAICNGLTAYGAVIPFCATFLNFTGYALGAVRLSALSKFRVIYIMTHDSIGLGEDGPTHQPIETLAALRSMPNMYVFRPCDGNEVSGCYKVSIEHLTKSPSLFALSRQNVPNLAGTDIDKVILGGYVLEDLFRDTKDANKRKLSAVLVSSGSEVSICREAAELLIKNTGLSISGVRIVSMVCTRLFDEQSLEYKKSVFPEHVPVLSVEASCTFGWSKYAHMQLGVDTFGKSAPGEKVYEYFGLTKENVAENVKKLVGFYENRRAAWLIDVCESVNDHSHGNNKKQKKQ